MQLPEPLLPRACHIDVLNVASNYNLAIVDPIQFYKTLSEKFNVALRTLDSNHRTTLAYLVHHLYVFASNSRANKMTANTLGTVFAPLFFHCK